MYILSLYKWGLWAGALRQTPHPPGRPWNGLGTPLGLLGHARNEHPPCQSFVFDVNPWLLTSISTPGGPPELSRGLSDVAFRAGSI